MSALLLPRRALLRGGAALLAAPAIAGPARAARSGFSTSNYLTLGAAPAEAAPLTLFGWYKTTAAGANQMIVSVSDTTKVDGNTCMCLRVNGSNQVGIFEADGTTTATAACTPTITASTWQTAMGQFIGLSSRACLMNGGSKATNATTLVTGSTKNNTSIGVRVSSGAPTQNFQGTLGEIAVWKSVRSDFEAAALAGGVPVYTIAWPDLVAYVPLWGITSPEADLAALAHVWTITGSLSKADNPPMTFPHRRRSALMGDALLAFLETKDKLSAAARAHDAACHRAFYGVAA